MKSEISGFMFLKFETVALFPWSIIWVNANIERDLINKELYIPCEFN